jgi:hypothetical protein
VLSAAVLTVMIWLAVRNYATLLGVPPGSPASHWLPALYPVAALAGAGWALVAGAGAPTAHSTAGQPAGGVPPRHRRHERR